MPALTSLQQAQSALPHLTSCGMSCSSTLTLSFPSLPITAYSIGDMCVQVHQPVHPASFKQGCSPLQVALKPTCTCQRRHPLTAADAQVSPPPRCLA